MKRRFTLVELLIVVGIIAILATVIMPKISLVKDRTKEAGIDTNLRMVQSYIEGRIHEYSSTDADILEKDIQKAFSDNIQNPITRGEGVSEYSQMGSLTPAIVYYNGDNSLNSIQNTWENYSDPRQNMKGTVLVTAYPDPNGSNSLYVNIYPYDRNGNIMVSKKIVIKP